jgi:hypothetical protein
MNAFTQYSNINTNGKFFPTNFPEIDKEISMIKTQTTGLRNPDQCAMMISYFKDHKIRTDLTRSQSTLVSILLSMNACRHIEGLFEAGKHNEQFNTGFENYLLKELSL